MKKNTIINKNFIYTLLIASFAGFTHQVFNIVFPVYILDIGETNAMTGLMMTGLTVATLITRILFGTTIDTWGRKKTLILGSSLFMLNTLAYCFVRSTEGLFFLRICNGISQGIFFPVPPTIVADVSPKERLADALGWFGIAGSLPVAFAPTIGLYVYQTFGANILFLLCTITAGIAVLFSLLINDHYRPIQVKTTIKEKLKVNYIIEIGAVVPSLICLTTYLGYSSITNFLTPCGLERGITQISYFFMVNTLAVIIARLTAGRLSKRFGIKNMISMGIVLTTLSIILIAFSYNLTFMIIASILLAFGITLISQLIQVYIMNQVDEHRRGAANTTMMLFSDIGTGIGSMVWGYVSAGGYVLTYLLSAMTVTIGALIQKFKLK